MARTRWAVCGIVASAALLVPAGVAVQAQAAGSVRASVSLTAPASGVYGSAIKLTGRLWRTGTSSGLPGATVWLQRSAHAKGAYGNLRSAKTAPNGTYAFSVTQTGAYDYRVRYGGSATYTTATSPTRYPVTNRKLLFDSIATISWETGALRATGRAVPAPPNGTTVTLQVYSGGRWMNLASGRTSSGKVTINTTRPGSVASYRIVTGARYPYGAGASAARRFTHYKWRGAFTKLPLYTFAQGPDSFIYFHPASADPTRSTVTMSMPGAGYLGVVPDTSGCTRIRSVTSNGTSTNRTTLRHFVNQAQVATAEIGPGSGELTMTSAFAANTQVEYNASWTAGFAVLARIKVLCGN